MIATELQIIIEEAVNEDWELVKDTAGAVADRKTIFDLAFRFGWHAAMKRTGYPALLPYEGTADGE